MKDYTDDEIRALPAENQPVACEFITIHYEAPPEGRKLPRYLIVNNRSGERIGTIMWYGPWRQWCLFPEFNTVWSGGCLDDVRAIVLAARVEAQRKST